MGGCYLGGDYLVSLFLFDISENLCILVSLRTAAACGLAFHAMFKDYRLVIALLTLVHFVC